MLKKIARFYKKKIILGTSHAWSTSRLSHQPSKQKLYCRLMDFKTVWTIKAIWENIYNFVKVL